MWYKGEDFKNIKEIKYLPLSNEIITQGNLYKRSIKTDKIKNIFLVLF